MKFHFATATKPPKVNASYAQWLGYVIAAINGILAIVYLFRSPVLLPDISKAMSSGLTTAGWFVAVVILAELCSAPFLLRMRLSVAARLFSGLFVVLAPLMWTLLGIWVLGSETTTGQFGNLFAGAGALPLVVLNVAWLSLSFFALWALGYNNISLKIPKKPVKKPGKRSKKA